MRSGNGKQLKRKQTARNEQLTQDINAGPEVVAAARGVQVTATKWEAPLPPPDAVKSYEQTLPGSAKTIFAIFEKENAHRQEVEIREQEMRRETSESAHKSYARGQNYGVFISSLCVVAALASVYLGAHWLVSVTLVGVPMVSTVKSFLRR